MAFGRRILRDLRSSDERRTRRTARNVRGTGADALGAPSHPHNVARDVFVEVDGLVQPAPGAAVQPYAGRDTGAARRGHEPGVVVSALRSAAGAAMAPLG